MLKNTLVFRRRLLVLVVGLGFCLYFGGCIADKGKNIPDVSHINASLNIDRFERDLQQLDTSNIDNSRQALAAKYPVFLEDIYLSKILPPLQQPEVFEAFLKSKGIRKLMDTVDMVYGNFDGLEAKLEEAFRFYKYYFPEREVPKVVTYISEYSLGAFTFENLLGIGLDFHLGEEYPYYNHNYFPRYIRRTMNREHLVAKAMQALVSDLVGETRSEKLLDLMVNNGKTLYVLDRLLPHMPDSIKLGYTAAETQWCRDNELLMWAHFLNEDLLYSTSLSDIRKLVDHSPNSPGMPPEAPGRTANWMGWQIVKAYMKRHPETSLSELIAIDDAQLLLNKAKYKPR